MIRVFVGGSRQISRLPEEARVRLKNVMERRHSVLVGDANGVDKAVQKYLADARYDHVTVYCSGDKCRNNVGSWETREVSTQESRRDFNFYAAKDREMAREAEFGLMIWDGKSLGTIVNLLRLVHESKKAVLIDVSDKQQVTLSTKEDWEALLSKCHAGVRDELMTRIAQVEKISLFSGQEAVATFGKLDPEANSRALIETQRGLDMALENGDAKTFIELLGKIARDRGMTYVAQETGLAREALYRALSAKGNPEFATVLRAADAVGLRLRTLKKHDG